MAENYYSMGNAVSGSSWSDKIKDLNPALFGQIAGIASHLADPQGAKAGYYDFVDNITQSTAAAIQAQEFRKRLADAVAGTGTGGGSLANIQPQKPPTQPGVPAVTPKEQSGLTDQTDRLLPSGDIERTTKQTIPASQNTSGRQSFPFPFPSALLEIGGSMPAPVGLTPEQISGILAQQSGETLGIADRFLSVDEMRRREALERDKLAESKRTADQTYELAKAKFLEDRNQNSFSNLISAAKLQLEAELTGSMTALRAAQATNNNAQAGYYGERVNELLEKMKILRDPGFPTSYEALSPAQGWAIDLGYPPSSVTGKTGGGGGGYNKTPYDFDNRLGSALIGLNFERDAITGDLVKKDFSDAELEDTRRTAEKNGRKLVVVPIPEITEGRWPDKKAERIPVSLTPEEYALVKSGDPQMLQIVRRRVYDYASKYPFGYRKSDLAKIRDHFGLEE